MTVPLEKLITEAALAKLAGTRSFERGVAYFEHQAVLSLIQAGSTVKARVLGTEEYRVSLRAAGSGLGWSCTCPLGDEGEFCKHAVAAGLAWLARKGTKRPAPMRTATILRGSAPASNRKARRHSSSSCSTRQPRSRICMRGSRP